MLQRMVLGVVGLGCWLLAGCGPRGGGEPLWIGHLAPLSGPDRAQGEQARQGIQLAVNELVATEKAGSGRPIKVIHVDGRDDETVRSETVRLLTVNKVAALLGSLNGTQAELLVREAQPYGVPVVLTGEAAGTGRAEGVFCLGIGASQRGQILARRAQALKASKVAVISDSRLSLDLELASAFIREYRKEGEGTVKEWTVTAENKDGVGFLDEVVRWQPEAVLLSVRPRDCLEWGKRLKQANLKAPLFYGGEDAGPSLLLPNTTDLPLEMATVYAPTELTARGQEWVKNYKETFREPPDYFAAQAYDGARLLFQALRLRVSGVPLRERVGRVENFESLTGPLSFKDRRTRRKVFLLELGRESKVLKTIPPEPE